MLKFGYSKSCALAVARGVCAVGVSQTFASNPLYSLGGTFFHTKIPSLLVRAVCFLRDGPKIVLNFSLSVPRLFAAGCSSYGTLPQILPVPDAGLNNLFCSSTNVSSGLAASVEIVALATPLFLSLALGVISAVARWVTAARVAGAALLFAYFPTHRQ